MVAKGLLIGIGCMLALGGVLRTQYVSRILRTAIRPIDTRRLEIRP